MPDRHLEHDLGLVVAYADGELDATERAIAQDQIDGCASCALLVSDLRALQVADRELATAARPRDFRLTTADAERLRAASTAEHPNHDPVLIAAAVDGTLDGEDRRLADGWLSDCHACAALFDDLMAITAANRALVLPARPRTIDSPTRMRVACDTVAGGRCWVGSGRRATR